MAAPSVGRHAFNCWGQKESGGLDFSKPPPVNDKLRVEMGLPSSGFFFSAAGQIIMNMKMSIFLDNKIFLLSVYCCIHHQRKKQVKGSRKDGKWYFQYGSIHCITLYK